MKRVIALCAAVFLLCAGTALAAGKSLVVAHDTNFKPFEYKDKDGKYTGFDIELWDAIAKKAGIRSSPWISTGLFPVCKRGSLTWALPG